MPAISAIESKVEFLGIDESTREALAGKGFAVVASEVKSLANQTARATDEISSQIAGMQSATEGAVGAIGGVGKQIGDMNEITTAIATAVEEHNAATSEISRNVSQATDGVTDVSNNISGVTASASETNQAASHILGAATGLSTQSGTLTEVVEKFMGEIRTA